MHQNGISKNQLFKLFFAKKQQAKAVTNTMTQLSSQKKVEATTKKNLTANKM